MMNMVVDKDKVCLLFHEYVTDPNCWPELWISGENVNDAERELFIQMATDRVLFNRYLDKCEKLHP